MIQLMNLISAYRFLSRRTASFGVDGRGSIRLASRYMKASIERELDKIMRFYILEGVFGERPNTFAKDRRTQAKARKLILSQSEGKIHSDWLSEKETGIYRATFLAAKSVMPSMADDIVSAIIAGVNMKGEVRATNPLYKIGQNSKERVLAGEASPKTLQGIIASWAKKQAISILKSKKNDPSSRFNLEHPDGTPIELADEKIELDSGDLIVKHIESGGAIGKRAIEVLKGLKLSGAKAMVRNFLVEKMKQGKAFSSEKEQKRFMYEAADKFGYTDSYLERVIALFTKGDSQSAFFAKRMKGIAQRHSDINPKEALKGLSPQEIRVRGDKKPGSFFHDILKVVRSEFSSRAIFNMIQRKLSGDKVDPKSIFGMLGEALKEDLEFQKLIAMQQALSQLR